MVYVGRSADSLPFVDEVARFGERVEIRTDDVSGVPTAAELLGDCPDGTTVYACGPAPMLTAIRAELAGRDDVELHFERFAAPPVVDGREFSVSIASTGQQVVASRADETLLTALRRVGRARRRTPASRASAARAGPGWSPAPSTTATRCSPSRNAPAA